MLARMYQLVIKSPNSFSAATDFFTVFRPHAARSFPHRSMRKSRQQDQAGNDDAGKIDDKKGGIHTRSLRLKRLKLLTSNDRAAAKFRIENSPCRYTLLLIRGGNVLEGAHETAKSLSDRDRIWLRPSPFSSTSLIPSAIGE
jgi:hypothetical protein